MVFLPYFKMVMSSDKHANIREPIVVVEFQMQTDNGMKMESLEMNKEELKDFLDSLENTNKVSFGIKILFFI